VDDRVAWLTLIFLQVLMWAIVARSLLSWFPMDPSNPLVQLLNAVTEPILQPLRRIVPRMGMIDITPMAAILILIVLSFLINSAREPG
jgi:YggT family protein